MKSKEPAGILRPLEPPVNEALDAATRTASPTPIVAIVKYGPRSRKAGRPIATEKSAPRTAASGSVQKGLIPFSESRTVV